MGEFPQALEITSEVQMKRNNEMITRLSNFKKMFFPFFFSWTSPIFKSHNFFNSYSFTIYCLQFYVRLGPKNPLDEK
jgi:hypothetical protein